MNEMCACGQPLHYSNPQTEQMVRKLIAMRGEYVTITCMGQKYKVQRHFIALHGIRGIDLPKLERQGIIVKD